MTIVNAIKKLEKSGWMIARVNSQYVASKVGNGHVISFLSSGPESQEVACLRVRRTNDFDEIQSDYHAGVYVDSMVQALRRAV
jgi:hypothetical protein